jgi:uncharacterized protein (TIGR03083 family)
MTSPQRSDPGTARDPDLPARLLRAEHDALLPILRRTPEAKFGNATACPGWSVRDVLAHCGSALHRAITGELHSFTPEENEADVAERRQWPLADALSELADGYLSGGEVIVSAGGRLDGIALGEWIHGGDVRDALGEPQAYASEGYDDACVLLAERMRRREVPLVKVDAGNRRLVLGTELPDRPTATLRTDRATLMRLVSGRPAAAADYELTGATPEELLVF